MKTIPNARESYLKGIEATRAGNSVNARFYFELALQDDAFCEKALCQLIYWDFKEGKYADVRKRLEENEDIDSFELKWRYGKLEQIEYNFNASRKYYEACLESSQTQKKALLSLAKLYIQNEENAIAQKMLETLQLDESYHVRSTFALINLKLLEEDYDMAYYYLNMIDFTRLVPAFQKHYHQIHTYLLFLMGKLKDTFNQCDLENGYIKHRLLDPHEEVLIDHISRHLNQADQYQNGCFFQYTDLKKLLDDARSKIEEMNANHFELTDFYCFSLPAPIGFKGNQVTNDLCVTTLIGTKDIITMYPVLFSDQFDQEHNAFNRQYVLKQNGKGEKNDQ